MKAGYDDISSARSVTFSIIPMFDIETGDVSHAQPVAGPLRAL
jgi:hypothetical protein